MMKILRESAIRRAGECHVLLTEEIGASVGRDTCKIIIRLSPFGVYDVVVVVK